MGQHVCKIAVWDTKVLPLGKSSECTLYWTWRKYFKPHLTVLYKYLVFLAFKSEQCYHIGNFYKKVQKQKTDLGMVSWKGNETNLPESLSLESILKKMAYSRTIILGEGSGKSLLFVCVFNAHNLKINHRIVHFPLKDSFSVKLKMQLGCSCGKIQLQK